MVEHGNNQELGAIRLTYKTADQGGFNLVDNDTIEITFDGLTITNVADINKITLLEMLEATWFWMVVSLALK